jgi:glycosyltransferase involved in cell wall biosynthesis
MQRPNILFMTIHACQMPGSGGNVRSHFFAKTAASIGNLNVVSLCNSTGQSFSPQVAALCQNVWGGEAANSNRAVSTPLVSHGLKAIVAPWKNDWIDFVANCVQHCGASSISRSWKYSLFRHILSWEQNCLFRLGRIPPLASLTWYQEYQHILKRHGQRIANEEFDIIWIEDVFTWPYARDLLGRLSVKPKLILCNTYNIETNVAQRIAKTATTKTASEYARCNSKQLSLLEKDAYQTSNLTIVCSEEDRISGIQLAPRGNYNIIGNGVDVDYFKAEARTQTESSAPQLLFTGTFSYAPNQQAVRFFASEIMPLVKAEIPSAKFVIAGSQAANLHSQLSAEGFKIESVSDPVDIRPCFRNASLFVVPIQSGGGTRLKILEAMAMEVPIVSTTIGAEGLGVSPGKQLDIADTPDEFARCCVNLLKNPTRQATLSQQATTWVRANYSWDYLCDKAKRLVEMALYA